MLLSLAEINRVNPIIVHRTKKSINIANNVAEIKVNLYGLIMLVICICKLAPSVPATVNCIPNASRTCNRNAKLPKIKAATIFAETNLFFHILMSKLYYLFLPDIPLQKLELSKYILLLLQQAIDHPSLKKPSILRSIRIQ